MTLNKKDIRVPRENVNDEYAQLIEWKAQQGQEIHKGEVVAEAETTKGSFEIVSNDSGYFYPLKEPPTRVQVGSVIAWISEKVLDESELQQNSSKTDHPTSSQEPKVSRKALKLLQSKGLSLEDFKGFSEIRVADVEAFQKTAAPPLEKTTSTTRELCWIQLEMPHPTILSTSILPTILHAWSKKLLEHPSFIGHASHVQLTLTHQDQKQIIYHTFKALEGLSLSELEPQNWTLDSSFQANTLLTDLRTTSIQSLSPPLPLGVHSHLCLLKEKQPGYFNFIFCFDHSEHNAFQAEALFQQWDLKLIN